MYDLKVLADNDTSPLKADLGVGIYRNENGTYHGLSCIKEVCLSEKLHLDTPQGTRTNYQQAKKKLLELNPGNDVRYMKVYLRHSTLGFEPGV